MAQDSCSSVPSRNWRRRRHRHRCRPRRNLVLTKIAVVITTLMITSCCWYSSLLGTCHALLVPSTTLTISPLSTQVLKPTRTRQSFGNRITSNNNSNSNSKNNNDYNHKNHEFALFMAPQTPQPRQPRRMLKKRPPKEGDGRRRKRNRRNRHAEYDSSSTVEPFGTVLPGIISTNGKNIDVGNLNNKNSRGKSINSDAITSNNIKNNVSNNNNNNNNNLAAETLEYLPLVPSVRRDKGEDYWIDPEDLERERRRIEDERKRIALRNQNTEDMPREKLMTEVKAPYRQNWIGNFSLVVALLSILVSKFPELLELPTSTIRFPDYL